MEHKWVHLKAKLIIYHLDICVNLDPFPCSEMHTQSSGLFTGLLSLSLGEGISELTLAPEPPTPGSFDYSYFYCLGDTSTLSGGWKVGGSISLVTTWDCYLYKDPLLLSLNWQAGLVCLFFGLLAPLVFGDRFAYTALSENKLRKCGCTGLYFILMPYFLAMLSSVLHNYYSFIWDLTLY